MHVRLVLRHAVQDRALIGLWLAFVLLIIVVLISFAFQIRPNDINVPIRYSAFGITHFYNDSWWYHFTFVGFGVLTAIIHSLIALKLHAQRSAFAARFFLVLSIVVVIISFFYLSSVLGLTAAV